MAEMAFRVGAVGVSDFAYGHTIIGIKTPTVKVFSVSSWGDTGLGVDLMTTSPFTIEDSSVLTKLFNERISLEIKGPALSKGGSSMPIEFKIFNESGDVVYALDKSVYVKGGSIGGWTVNSERLEMIYPSNTRPREDDAGEKFAEMLGLIPKGTGHLNHEPNGVWEVKCDNTWTYYYCFLHGGVVWWCYDKGEAKWGISRIGGGGVAQGTGRWAIKRHALEIDWYSGDKEKWPVPFMTEVKGQWNTPKGETHQMKAMRVP